MPRVRDDTADVAFIRTVSFTNVVPQSFVIIERVTLTVHAFEAQAGGAAVARAGIWTATIASRKTSV